MPTRRISRPLIVRYAALVAGRAVPAGAVAAPVEAYFSAAEMPDPGGLWAERFV